MLLALRICPVAEKVFAVLFILAGIYCLLKTIKESKTEKNNNTEDIKAKLETGICNKYLNEGAVLDSQKLLNQNEMVSEKTYPLRWN